MMKKIVLLLTLLLPIYALSYNWIQFGPDSISANSIHFYIASNHNVICTDAGLWIDDIQLYEQWSFYETTLPVLDAVYRDDSTFLFIMGDGSWSDGIWSFNTNTKEMEVVEYCIFPSFIEYNSNDNKIYAGYGYGLYSSLGGYNWDTVSGFNDVNVTAISFWQDHIIVGSWMPDSYCYHSSDLGQSWVVSDILPGAVIDIHYTPAGELYACLFLTGGMPSGLYSSTDHGSTWSQEFPSDGVLADVTQDVMGDVYVCWDAGPPHEHGIAKWEPDSQNLLFINGDLPYLQMKQISVNPGMAVIHLFIASNDGVKYCPDYYTSITERQNEFRLYPNPAKDIMYIESNTAVTQIRIFSNSGQLIDELSVSDAMQYINTSHLQRGVYFFELTSENNRFIEKVIKY